MVLDKVLVLIFGLGLAVFVLWYFLGKTYRIAKAGKVVTIKVDGGYDPEAVEIPVGQVTEIIFIRSDPNTCLEEVVLGDFKIKKFLPLGKPVAIKITPPKKGEYSFSCGMNMFHGKLRVV
ncbi:MAG TPA: cupredoxin domain-containing protein [Patescibacteria group bacterium]|nr:cupredoxin domain-containing protein [Patescibacteria group bacterium]